MFILVTIFWNLINLAKPDYLETVLLLELCILKFLLTFNVEEDLSYVDKQPIYN